MGIAWLLVPVEQCKQCHVPVLTGLGLNIQVGCSTVLLGCICEFASDTGIFRLQKRRRVSRPGLPAPSVSRCSGHYQSLIRIVRGLDPVQRLNARENAAGSEKPTR
jgi:hypothetical protein